MITANENSNFESVWKSIEKVAEQQSISEKILQETRNIQKEILLEQSKYMQETWNQLRQTDIQIKELGKQIGGIGNKFGSFNEGLVLPSLYKLFKEKFGCKDFAERYQFFSNGNSMEIDLFALSETSCFLIEIKSHFKSDAIKQLQKQIEIFRKYKKEYSDRKLFGVIVATHYDKANIKELYKNGIYFISITDDLVDFQIPDDFQPRAW